MKQYKNYHIMQKVRRELFACKNILCENCNIKPATIIHHKDFTRFNHSKNNLIVLCKSCHAKLHWANSDFFPRKTTIYYKGKDLKEWSRILNVKVTTLYARLYRYGNLQKNSISENTYGMNYRQIANLLHISHQRVHQLHKEGKLKLRLATLTNPKT